MMNKHVSRRSSQQQDCHPPAHPPFNGPLNRFQTHPRRFAPCTAASCPSFSFLLHWLQTASGASPLPPYPAALCLTWMNFMLGCWNLHVSLV